MEINEFELQVIKQSNEMPVLVDFWAPWCGPCKVIGPVLEELSQEANGKWKLVKVNVDESQELSGKYGIRGIPNMKLFVDGEVVAEQTGALPKHEMQKWLESQIPDPRQLALSAITQRLKSGDTAALEELKSFVTENKDLDEAKLILAEHSVIDDPQLANKLLNEIARKELFVDRLAAVNDLSELMTSTFEKHGGVSEKLANAQVSLKKGDMKDALENIIDSVVIDKYFNQDLPRRSGIALFNMLGQDHEITRSLRRKFDMSLY